MDLAQIKPGAEVIGADGVYIGTVNRIDGRRIKITRQGAHATHKNFIDGGLVADVEDGKVRLSANADVVVLLEDED